MVELRIWDEAGTFRVVYVAKLADAVYVLHCFQKKTQQTAKRDIDLARKRLKELLKDKKNNYRINEVRVPVGSSLDGKKLGSTNLRDHGLVVAVKDAAGAYTYNPPASFRIEAGMELVILARAEDVALLHLALGT